MKTLKKLGIWLDHSNAYLIEFSSEVKETKTKRYTIERKLHRKRSLKAAWYSKTTPTTYSVPKAKRKYKRKGHETHKIW